MLTPWSGLQLCAPEPSFLSLSHCLCTFLKRSTKSSENWISIYFQGRVAPPQHTAKLWLSLGIATALISNLRGPKGAFSLLGPVRLCSALFSSSSYRNEKNHSSQSCFLEWRRFSESELRMESPGSPCGTHRGAHSPWYSGFSSHLQLPTANTAALCSREFSGCWRVGDSGRGQTRSVGELKSMGGALNQ